MMRKVLSVASFMVLTTAIPALAAEFAVKPRVIAPAPVQLWTGCYIGGHVGGAISQDTNTNRFGSSGSYSADGFVGGGQVGCDYEFAGGWVAGVEGRAAWSSLDYNHPRSVIYSFIGVTVPSQFSIKNDFLASATTRLGYSFANSGLVFVRGGAAWTREKLGDSFTTPAGNPFFPGGIAVDPNSTRMRAGWTVGTGVDWAFAPHWSVNVEYNYYDFGNGGTLAIDPANGATVNFYKVKDTLHAVTTGVNYRF